MKKKILTFLLIVASVFGLSACGKSNINLNDYIIEERHTLFTAQDNLYTVTLSSGLREENYALDGIVNNKIDFAVLTIARNNADPLSNDTYTYTVVVNDQTYTGDMEKSATDNTYSADLMVNIPADATVNAEIKFTGYTFNQPLENTSNSFTVDKSKAIEIANTELKTELENLTADKNNKIEVVMKLLKDYSNTELKTYYWYVGIVSTNGETLGILIDANSGNIIAKKV